MEKQFPGRVADPEFRKSRSAKGAAVRTERNRLIKQIAEKLAGEPLSSKTVAELRELLAVGAR